MDARINWMVECGATECEAWIATMESDCLEEVQISTPAFIDYGLKPFHGPRTVMDYTIDVFHSALDILDNAEG